MMAISGTIITQVWARDAESKMSMKPVLWYPMESHVHVNPHLSPVSDFHTNHKFGMTSLEHGKEATYFPGTFFRDHLPHSWWWYSHLCGRNSNRSSIHLHFPDIWILYKYSILNIYSIYQMGCITGLSKMRLFRSPILPCSVPLQWRNLRPRRLKPAVGTFAASMRITEVSPRFGQTMLTWYAWYGIAWSILISAVG